MKILRRAEFEHRQLCSSRTGEKFSRSAVLSRVLESNDFFIHHEIISPGTRSSSPHSHEKTEEFIFVLGGRLVAVEGSEESDLSAGDCGVFSAGSEKLHYLVNRTTEDVEVLVVSKKLAAPDVKYASEVLS